MAVLANQIPNNYKLGEKQMELKIKNVIQLIMKN